MSNFFNKKNYFLSILHNRFVFQRRVQILALLLEKQLPLNSTILDIGCGDGLIASIIQRNRPDVTITGIDILLRPKTHIPVSLFDGKNIPFEKNIFDGAIFTDVLHHTEHPKALIAEANRISRQFILIKDHIAENWFDNFILRFMDWFGNASHGVNLPYTFLSEDDWKEIAYDLDMTIDRFDSTIPLYSWPASLLFGRSLHVIMKLREP